MEHLQQTLESVKSKTLNALGKDLYRIYLYGSCARGDDNSDSDIDVMIILDSDNIKEYEDKIDEITSDICLDYDVLLSTQITSKNKWIGMQSYLPLYQAILREGKIVYDKRA